MTELTVSAVATDPRSADLRDRYEREVGRTIETADKVNQDAGESLRAGVITQEEHDRICAMATEYANATLALLRKVYEIGDDAS